jgi:hypothetical protein
VSTSSSGILEDVRIGVPLKISALWIAMLFLFAYRDIFGFFRTGLIEEVIEGEVSGIEFTQLFLFGSRSLSPSRARWSSCRSSCGRGSIAESTSC